MGHSTLEAITEEDVLLHFQKNKPNLREAILGFLDECSQSRGFDNLLPMLLGLFENKHFTRNKLYQTLTPEEHANNYELGESIRQLTEIIGRYRIVDFLVQENLIKPGKLKGIILDIACHIGLTTDALAMYGGEVYGTDVGFFTGCSPSGRKLSHDEGISFVQNFRRRYTPEKRVELVACFDVDWVASMSYEGFPQGLHSAAMNTVDRAGQIIFTFSKDYKPKIECMQIPNTTMVELPTKGYAMVGIKHK